VLEENDKPSADSAAARFVERWVDWTRDFTESWIVGQDPSRLSEIKANIIQLLGTEQYQIPEGPAGRPYGLTKLTGESLRNPNQGNLISPDVFGYTPATTTVEGSVLVPPGVPASIITDPLTTVVEAAVGQRTPDSMPDVTLGRRKVQPIYLRDLARVALELAVVPNIPMGSFNIAAAGGALTSEEYADIINQAAEMLHSSVRVGYGQHAGTNQQVVTYDTQHLEQVLQANNLPTTFLQPEVFIPEIATQYFEDLKRIRSR
jgi:hypothetical protein